MQIKDLKKRTVTPFQILVLYYFIAIVTSFGLLRLPGVHLKGVEVSYLDSLFTAVSAVSVTGLTTINVSETYTNFGLSMVLLILQFGAVGIMTVGTFLWLIVGRRIGMQARQLIMIDHNQTKISGVVTLIQEIVKILLVIETFGTIILTLHFHRYFDTWQEAFKNGVFMAISSTTNGGFDLTGASLQMYHDDYFVQFVTMVLIVLGAIGFPVLIEVKSYLFGKQRAFRFTLFTKITTFTYMALFFVGTFVILLLESFGSFKGMKWHEALFSAMYHSVSTRSAGLTTQNVQSFGEATDIFMSFLMFIGASPSSVGGGIRTTTFAIAILFLITYANGRERIQVFKREIHTIDIFRSFVVIILAMFMVMVSTMVLLISEQNLSAIQILFEVTSAFGTCGMSLGVTENLTSFGKCVIMVLMFVGRVGLISFLYSLGGKTEKMYFHYPKERVIIG